MNTTEESRYNLVHRDNYWIVTFVTPEGEMLVATADKKKDAICWRLYQENKYKRQNENLHNT